MSEGRQCVPISSCSEVHELLCGSFLLMLSISTGC